MTEKRNAYAKSLMHKTILFLLLFYRFGASVKIFAQSPVFFTDVCTGIMKYDPETSKVDTIVPLIVRKSIALDLRTKKMYWTDWGANKIQRSNFDGSQVEDLITQGLLEPDGLALDTLADKMYWTDWGTRKIRRADLNGGNVEDLVTGLRFPKGIALDLNSGKMYWADAGSKIIQRANLDGTQVDTLVSDLFEPDGLELDVAQGKMYWADWGSKKIQQANLDGSQMEDLINQGLSAPNGISLDLTTRKIYWTDRVSGKIQKANLDGTAIQDVIAGVLEYPEGIALDLESGKIYWTDNQTTKLQRANLDGSQVEDIFSLGIVQPTGITINPYDNKIYWTDRTTNRIQRANLDGSALENIIDLSNAKPEGIALDFKNNTVVWTESTGKIQKADLNGENVQILIDNNLINPKGIALDLKNNTMYWINQGMKKIGRSNLDGTLEEDIVTALQNPVDIALDTENGKIYWTDPSAKKIQRANLDGSNVEVVISNQLMNPYGLLVDTLSNVMYWSDQVNRKIQKISLDGESVEDVLTQGIACFKVEDLAVYYQNIDDPRPAIVGQADVCLNKESTYTTTSVASHSYHWQIENGLILGRSDSSAVQVLWDKQGLGMLKVLEVNSQGLADSSSMQIQIHPLPQPHIEGNVNVCLDNINYYTYNEYAFSTLLSWEVEGGSLVSGQGTETVQVIWTEEDNKQISLTEYEPLLQCENSTVRIIDKLEPEVKIALEGSQAQLCEGGQVKLSIQSNLDIISYNWYKSGETQAISDGSFLWINQPGQYWVETESSCGNVSSEIFQLGSTALFVPDLFSPNGDGNNDYFTVCSDDPSRILTMELTIFDKKGLRVFQSSQIQELICRENTPERGWDGGNYPTDTYLWTLKVKFENCGEKQQQGYIKLIR